MTALDIALKNYLAVLADVGSLTPLTIVTRRHDDVVERLSDLEEVNLPEELKEFLHLAAGYDEARLSDLSLFEPEFARNMFLIGNAGITSHYEDCAGCGGDENPHYWPMGFVPILRDGAGSYITVNCNQKSTTFGAVYDMSHGVGMNRLSSSVADFLQSCAREFESGLRVWSGHHSAPSVSGGDYLSRAGALFGNSPYFARAGRLGSQIVDWLPGRSDSSTP